MSAVREQPKTKRMPFAVRPLEERDIAQSAQIERDAFPALFPPTSFHREIKSRKASYLVAWRRDDTGDDRANAPVIVDPVRRDDNRSVFDTFLNNVRSFLPKGYSASEPGLQFVAGFLGLWYVSDEAHIVAVGVRQQYRGRGIGELLLIGAIEQAMARDARVMALEVRASNHVARNLYVKYGFNERGLRKAYYTDNREDAIIMTADLMDRPERFQKLSEAHRRRWGHAERVLF